MDALPLARLNCEYLFGHYCVDFLNALRTITGTEPKTTSTYFYYSVNEFVSGEKVLYPV